MINYINNILEYAHAAFHNPVSSGIGLTAIGGAIFYELRSIPARAWSLLEKLFVSSITVDSTADSFEEFDRWVSSRLSKKFNKSLQILPSQNYEDGDYISHSTGTFYFMDGFEMCEIKFHIKLPIFIARQWIRHRMASVNEYSARYSILDREFYIPDSKNLAAQSASNRQGRGDILDPSEAGMVLDILREDAIRCHDNYLVMLNEDENGNKVNSTKKGLARELARMNLTLNTYTQWYWKIDLHNLLHFLSLRADSHAQYEIRAYAGVMLNIVEAWVPLAVKAFRDYRLNAVTFSAQMVDVLRRMMDGESVEQQDSGLSKREWVDFLEALAPTARA